MERYELSNIDQVDRTITVDDNFDIDGFLDTAGKVATTYQKVTTAINAGNAPSSPAVQQLIAQAPTKVPNPVTQSPSQNAAANISNMLPSAGGFSTTTWIITGVVGLVVIAVIIFVATRK